MMTFLKHVVCKFDCCIIRPPTGPRSGPGGAIHVMMGDNREGWFLFQCRQRRLVRVDRVTVDKV